MSKFTEINLFQFFNFKFGLSTMTSVLNLKPEQLGLLEALKEALREQKSLMLRYSLRRLNLNLHELKSNL